MLRLFTFLSALVWAAEALLCPAGSQCAPNCGNVLSATTPADLVCDSNAFKTDPTGQLFAGCFHCQRSSAYYSGNDSDIQSMLYNARYALSYCVWGDKPVKNPQVVDTPCITSKACGPFQDSVQFKNLSTDYDAYQYCDLWPVNDGPDFTGCTECLQAAGHSVMANFFIALQAGCQQKPEPGLLIGLDGEIFSTTAVQISTPSPIATANPAWFNHGTLTLGAKVGIAIGGLIGLLVLLGCGIVVNGKRKRRAYLRNLDEKHAQQEWPSQSRQHEMGETPGQQLFHGYDDTPISQRPLRGWDDTPVSQLLSHGWDDSPMTPNGEKSFSKYVSPYSSQYNSPISALEGHAMQWPHAASAQNHHVCTATNDNAAGVSWTLDHKSDDKGKSRVEAYEMHDVASCESENPGSHHQKQRNEAPVTNHPGYGGQDDTNPAENNLNTS